MNRIKIPLFIVIIFIMASSIFSYIYFDNNFLITKWNIPTDYPGFLDSRQFTWAAEAHAQGYDPLIENPINPRGHQLNYPRIWHLFFFLGIKQNHTNLIGSIVVVLFFIGLGIFWFSRKFDNLTYVFLTVVILSPPVMLGIERSNIELVIFLILSLALTVNYYSSISALFLFIFASILKLYPVFGFFYLLKESKRRFWILFLLASFIFILYAVLSLNDFIQVYKTTPKLVGSSFGVNIWWMGLQHKRFFNLSISDNLVILLKVSSYILAFLILMVTLLLSMNRKNTRLLSEAHYIDAFRVGAGIYICCFLLMNTHGFSLLPFMTLSAMVFSFWSFFIMRILGRNLTFVLEELANWIVLSGLLYLFFASLPNWVHNYLYWLFSKLKFINRGVAI
jgi:hypothetical protein